MSFAPPPIKGEEVIIHGDFIQFHVGARCQACQARNLKCLLQENDEGCMSCAGAGRDCVFSRTMTVTGPKAIFSWGALLAREQGNLQLGANATIASVAAAGAKAEPLTITPAPTQQSRPLFTPEPSSARLSTADLPSPALPRGEQRPQPVGSAAAADTAGRPGHANVPGAARRRDRSGSESDRSRRNGLDPVRRSDLGDSELPSIVDQDLLAQVEQKNAQIYQWLEKEPEAFDDVATQGSIETTQPSQTRDGLADEAVKPATPTRSNIGRKGTGNARATESEADASQPPESPPASISRLQYEREANSASPTAMFSLIDAHPWIEPLRFPSMPGTISQPTSSNAAIVRFNRCAETVETASRAASEGDHGGFLGEQEMDLLAKHPGILSRLSLGPPSMAPPDFSIPPASAPATNRVLRPKPTMEIAPALDTSPSLERSKTTPIISTPHIGDPPKRSGSNRPANYTSRWATVNASPKSAKSNRTRSIGHRISRTATELSEDMDDSQPMEFTVDPSTLSGEPLEPTWDSFSKRIREREPRIEDFLLERLTKEQLHRYKGLVDLKADHTHAQRTGTCTNGAFCTESQQLSQSQGSAPEKVATPATPAEKGEDGSEAGYAIEAALFPPGVPLPPVKRLPAEFECPFCFCVRQFQKPSDWSKHIQEDVAPFICTFPHCPEPKSFKRKADWVRHENERHRQLEWWQCNKEGCMHVCFRRDNFVQHLVREHKMAEPKPKTATNASGRGQERATSSKHAAEEQVIKMVDTCRRETTKNSADEPCRFCGNRCNSFKKLTVHLARHMETISLPILDLVNRFDPDSGAVNVEVKPEPNTQQASDPPPPQAESPINVIVPASRTPTGLEHKDTQMSDSPKPPTSAGPPPLPADKSASKEKVYRCEIAGCTHDRSFASQNDLNRHMKGVHGIYQGGSDPRFFRCQGQDCSKEGKIWPRLDNFRGHIARMHPDEDVEELIRRSGFTAVDGLPIGDNEPKSETEALRPEANSANPEADSVVPNSNHVNGGPEMDEKETVAETAPAPAPAPAPATATATAIATATTAVTAAVTTTPTEVPAKVGKEPQEGEGKEVEHQAGNEEKNEKDENANKNEKESASEESKAQAPDPDRMDLDEQPAKAAPQTAVENVMQDAM